MRHQPKQKNRAVAGIARVFSILTGKGGCQILKEEPQPQVVFAFGLLTTKRDPSSPSV